MADITASPAFRRRVEEVKSEIVEMIEPRVLVLGSDAIIASALLQLGIERHFESAPDSKSVRALFDRALRQVRDRQKAGHGT